MHSENNELISWVEKQIAALFLAEEDSEFQTSFDTAFAANAEVVSNSESISREKFRENIAGLRGAMVKADVKFDELITIPKDAEHPGQAGIVSGIYTVTRSLKFRVRAAPAQSKRVVHFSAKVEQDASVEGNDKRRIVHLFETSVDKALHVNLQAHMAPHTNFSDLK